MGPSTKIFLLPGLRPTNESFRCFRLDLLAKMTSSVHDHESKLLEPYTYISELPGKNVRGKLIGAFQSWLHAPVEAVEGIQRIVDQLHNASLLIDDIEDDSEMRRGQPVAHHIFGVPATINCANYVYFLSLQKCQALGNPKALQVYTDEMLRLHQGQGLDIFWRDHLQCPTVDEYLEMVQNKTGGLFRLAVGLMQAFSDSTLDFIPLVNALAVYFQIRDDYVNLLDEAYMENKSYCEDLTEGKFSFPLIVAIRENPQDTRLLSILKQRTKSVHLKQYAVQYLRETGAVKLTIAKLNATVDEIRREIASLGGNSALERIVDGLHANIK
ncbi:putative polyprenyl synthetase, isoprenoid synthase domain superfamily [Plasmopara halstedii]